MRIRLTLICLLIITAAAAAVAQGPQGASRQYDPTKEVTVSGTVEDVFHPAGRNGTVGTHLNLKTDTGTIEVHVGPQSFVEKQGFSFEKGDAISVIGSKLLLGGKDVLIAREVKKGAMVLTLRDANGIPKWSGRGATAN